MGTILVAITRLYEVVKLNSTIQVHYYSYPSQSLIMISRQIFADRKSMASSSAQLSDPEDSRQTPQCGKPHIETPPKLIFPLACSLALDNTVTFVLFFYFARRPCQLFAVLSIHCFSNNELLVPYSCMADVCPGPRTDSSTGGFYSGAISMAGPSSRNSVWTESRVSGFEVSQTGWRGYGGSCGKN